MRSIVGFVFFIGLLSCSNQEKNDTQSPEILLEHTEALAFDSLKAAKYGSDDYGMKSYVIAFLKRGPNRDIDSTEAIHFKERTLTTSEKWLKPES